MITVPTRFTKQLGVRLPIIIAPMYPLSSIKLIEAGIEAGGTSGVQPLTLTHVFKEDLREALKKLEGPYCFNILLEDQPGKEPKGIWALIDRVMAKVFGDEQSRHWAKMEEWIQIALDEGCPMFDTALGKPDKVIAKIHKAGRLVYHKVTSPYHAQKGIDAGADGLILVNNDAGGHLGEMKSSELLAACRKFDVPLVCSGGISTPEDFVNAIEMGYDAVVLGTRAIASEESSASAEYKDALIQAKQEDITITRRVTGVPLSVIDTDFVRRVGKEITALEAWLFRFEATKKYLKQSFHKKAYEDMPKGILKGSSQWDNYLQAGKSVAGIDSIKSIKEIYDEFASAALEAGIGHEE